MPYHVADLTLQQTGAAPLLIDPEPEWRVGQRVFLFLIRKVFMGLTELRSIIGVHFGAF